MNIFEAIKTRRSIRTFKPKPVRGEEIEELLRLTIQAPSGRNRQPWRFIVLKGKQKAELTEVFYDTVVKLREDGHDIGGCLGTIRAMRQAPIIIMVYNACSRPEADHNGPRRYQWSVDTQSIGGAVQTLLLAATAMGLGTLWICNVFYAERELSEWLGREDELVAAVAVGYPDESPSARPRRGLEEVTEWKGWTGE